MMDRGELEAYILETYAVEPDHPWARDPGYAVFRHAGNRKWFALVMGIPGERLGLAGAGPLDVVNLKCGPLLAGSLRQEAGIYPAYHMNKAGWVSVVLNGGVDDERLKLLLDVSFDLTAPGRKKRGRERTT